MTGKQALLEQLQQDAGDGAPVALAQDQQSWLRDLRTLMARLEGWLQGAEFRDKLHVERQDWEIVEEDLGAYLVPTLTVVFRTKYPRKVQVLPRGMFVVGGIFRDDDGKDRRLVGASGRVDVVCGPARETLLRFMSGGDTTWRWLRRNEALDEDGFFEVLRQLIA